MNRFLILFFTLFLLFGLLSCATGGEPNDNADVFLQGVDALAEEDLKAAVDFFSKSREKSGTSSASLATEKILPLYYEQEKYAQLLKITKELLDEDNAEINEVPHYQVDSNYLYNYYLLAMIELEEDGIDAAIQQWVSNSSLTTQHYSFFSSETFEQYSQANILSAELEERIAIKTAIYERDYGYAVRLIVNAPSFDREKPEQYLKNLDSRYLSDIGKAFLYGTTDNIFFARALEEASLSYNAKSTEAFMCHFYAGRLYKKEGVLYTSDALNAFELAMEASVEEIDFDTALWYYLSATRETSSRTAITVLQEYAPIWNDPYYFDDFLEALAFQLLDNENYKGFAALYEYITPYASPESVSKYAYITAVLIEEDYITVEGDSKQNAIKEALKTAYNAQEGSLYYRMMASVKLEVSTNTVLKDLLERENIKESNDTEFEYILSELARRGYIEEAYSAYVKNSHLVSLDAASSLSRSLSLANNPSIDNNYADNFYPESLRLASQAFNQSAKDIPQSEMELLFPRYYTEFVVQSSEVYDIEEFLIYAIMRSESFFDHDVMSWAGAIGLTQLMPTTAGDVARKLKVRDYDLHNARQNIDFGMFYFDELIPREGVDNSILRALFSYNAGITNVRRWNRQFPELLDKPDLFLEKIPFAETREYGRKILSAAVMYGVLYYDMEVSEVVQAIMN